MQVGLEDQSAAVPPPADWLTDLAEVRSSIRDLSQALERLRSAVDRLALASPASDRASSDERGAPPTWIEGEESAQDETEPALDLAESVVAEAAPELDPEAVREQVRLEVERARAEIAAGGSSLEDAAEADGEPAEAPGQPSPLAARFLEPQYEQRKVPGAPMMVIDDAEGRVELVRVYDALARVGLTGEATLITYAPHTVKIGIDSLSLPEENLVASAVKAAFGRPCRVTREGNRITVMIPGDPASAA